MKRTRPPKGYTAGDLILGTVLGFVAALLVVFGATFLMVQLLPENSRAHDWLLTIVEIASVLAGVGAGGGVMRARVAERKRRFVERRTAALQQRRCPECDYDLRGTPDPRCPECGEAFTVQEWRLTTAAINDPAN